MQTCCVAAPRDMTRLLGLALCAVAVSSLAATPSRPHQAWKLSGNPVGHPTEGFDCGNGTCLLFVGESGFMDSASPLVAHRTSDGGLQWSSSKIKGLHNTNEDRTSRPNLVHSGSNFCVEDTDCGTFGDGPCVSRVACIDQKTGSRSPSPPPTPESVGGAGVEMHELPEADGLLLVYPNNVEPGQQQKARGADDGTAWLARFGPGSATPDYNISFPGLALETYFVVALDDAAMIFAVTAATRPDSHGNRGATCAVMMNADSGATMWNNTLVGDQAYFMALKAWSVVGASGSEVLVQVLQHNATAYDIQTGTAVWTSGALGGILTDDLKAVDDVVLTLKGGGDGDSNVLVAVSTTNGSLVWQYPTASQLDGMGGLEAFLWDFQCSSAAPNNDTALPAAVCWLGFSCTHKGGAGGDADCPALLMPPGCPVCGKAETTCNLAIDAHTGMSVYSLSSGLPDYAGGTKQVLFRLGDAVLLNGKSGTLSAMSVSNGSMLWAVPCSGCARSLLAFESVAPPKGACTAELVELCTAAKAAGTAQCGMCAGINAGLLHAAGCNNDQITAWCTSTPTSLISSSPSDESKTLVIAGSDSSLSSLPAVVVLDPATGKVQWTVTVNISGLPGSKGSSLGSEAGDGAHWSITPLWVERTAGDRNAGYSVYVSGLRTEQVTSEVGQVGHHGRRRAQSPPPPPVTFYDYFTWRVDSK